jgi:hypothetical protein
MKYDGILVNLLKSKEVISAFKIYYLDIPL